MGHTQEHDGIKSTVRTGNTVGSEAVKLASRGDDRIEARDIQSEADKEYFAEIEKAVTAKEVADWKDPFYVEVRVTKPGYLVNVVRRRFIGRRTLPEPQPDQALWRYYPATGNIEFLWALPDLDSINEISLNRQWLPDEEKELGQIVVDYLEKKLYSKHLKRK